MKLKTVRWTVTWLCCLFVVSGLEILRIFDVNGTFVNSSLSADHIHLDDVHKPARRLPYDVFIAPNGYYWSKDPHLVFLDETGRVLEPASGHMSKQYESNHTIDSNGRIGVHPNSTLHGNLLFIRPAGQYWHFHYQTVAQLILYLKSGIFERFKGQNNFVHQRKTDGIFAEILAFYGFTDLLKGWQPIEPNHKKGFGIQIASNYSLIVSSNTGIAGFIPILSTARFLNEKAMEFYYSRPLLQSGKRGGNNNNNKNGQQQKDRSFFHRRILIGRDDKEGSRGILNLPELQPVLSKYDIYYFNPGVNASYVKQVYVFSHAELVLGVSGTGFSTNIAFCHVNQTILLELIPPTAKTSTGKRVAEALQFKYYYPLSIGYNPSDKTAEASFHVNATELDRWLFRVFAAQR
jgi:hypothetical protein